ncbi:ABC transporter substrate-binding protein [Streptomyces sp. NPDC088910]|uniref:ABC transporter substrate-binding protein n=1 Tax=Streptomyces sp. NPDC088910 TaxID=3365911 RepID=UPI0038025465
MWHKKIVLASATVVLATGVTACSDSKSDKTTDAASAGSLETVTIALSNQANQSYLPLILAQRMGYFTKQGLNVKIANLQGTPQVSDALLKGDAQGMIGFYDSNLKLQLKGKNTQAVVQLLQAPGMVEMARTNAPSIKSPADLKGKNVGVTSLGSASSTIASYLAIHNNIAVADTHLVAVAAGATFVAAFEHNRIDAGVTTEPTISTLLKKQLGTIIADMRTAAGTKAALGGPYPGTALTVQTAWANSHKETVQKMVNAVYQTLQWMESHSAAEITEQVPADFYAGSGKDQYVQALANEMGMYNPTGQMPADAPQTVLRVLTAVDPTVKGKTIDLSKTYTDEYVQKAAQDHSAS